MSTAISTKASLINSPTLADLHAAHARGMQAQRLYEACALRMEEAGLAVIANALRFTAAQEKEHADIFAGLITAYGGELTPFAEAAHPALPEEPAALLSLLAHAEEEAERAVFPHFARTALAEGFPRISQTFLRIAETERLHGRRFRQYAQALREGTLFREESRVSWICLPCGELHAGREAPSHCASCGRGQGGFIRSRFHPFGVEG